VAEREAQGDFGYLIGEAEVPYVDPTAAAPADDQWEPPEPAQRWDAGFDAFDASTWRFEPAPVPWYRTGQGLTALIATTVAAIALVVSAVLLVFRGTGATVEETTPVTPPAPTTTIAPSATTSAPPPPPPPPPPPETSEAPPPPAQVIVPRTPRATKEPEIGVTRTPVTRSPLSVAPQRPGNPNPRN